MLKMKDDKFEEENEAKGKLKLIIKLKKEMKDKIRQEVPLKTIEEISYKDSNKNKKINIINNEIILKKNKKEIFLSFLHSLCSNFSFLKREVDNKNYFCENKNILYLNKERGNNKKSRNSKILVNNKIIIYLLLISFIHVLSNDEFIESNITLKIQGIGTKYIFRSFFGYHNYPNIIYINGKKQSQIADKYYFNLTDNIVKLIWNNTIDNCIFMFKDCNSITEIDLSNFDT